MNLAVTLVSFLVTVGVLVVIHELGHYAAARLMGVKILRFSVGFGRTLWMRRLGRDQTEWALAAIPLGGYVKMLDEREGEVAPEDRPRAFNRKGVWPRIFIVLAGPVANFLLAIAVYWVLFVVGQPGLKPVLAEPERNTPAAIAGFAEGDTLRSINGETVMSWADVRWELLGEAVNRSTVQVEVEGPSGERSTRGLDMSGITKDDLDKDFFAKLGLRAYLPKVPAIVGGVVAGSPAAAAGLEKGDRIVAIDGKPTPTWTDFTRTIAANADKPLTLTLERQRGQVTLQVTPRVHKDGAVKIGRIGVEQPPQLRQEFERLTSTVRYGPVEALPRAVAKVADVTHFSLKMLLRMVTGDVSWKNLSGPITIADYAGQTAQLGWVTWLGFLALVSVSLGVLNLLPIPLLDGGHLVYYFAELVKGSPVSERTMEIGQRFGLALLLLLTCFAFYNDLNRLFTG